MRARHAIVAGTLLAIASGAAVAQDNDRGFYAGAGIGRFDLKTEVDNFDQLGNELEDFDFDDDDNAWKVFVGYRFMPYLSAEVDYIDFGRTQDRLEGNGSSGDYSAELSGIAPYIVATLPLGPIELSARLGYLFYDVDLATDLDVNQLDFDSKSSAEDWIYGVGIGATFFEHLAAKIEYEEADVSKFRGASVDDASAYWLTAAWRF
ncbi:MAG: porin family protein [Steroidobacteraceae bacterium]